MTRKTALPIVCRKHTLHHREFAAPALILTKTMDVMKTVNKTLPALIFLIVSSQVQAGQLPAEYYIIGKDSPISVMTDGRDTYIPATSGLIITGSIADGDNLIVSGKPERIKAKLNNQNVVLAKGTPPRILEEKPAPNIEELRSRLKKTGEKLALIDSTTEENAPAKAAETESLPAAATPEPPAPTEKKWNIYSGEKIAAAMTRWAADTKWQVIWEGPDIVSQIALEVNGKFEDVVTEVMDALNRSNNPVRARFYESNKIIRIMEKQ